VVRTFDLELGGRRGIVASGVIVGRDGLVLLDPGPSSCAATLRAALARLGYTIDDVRAVLLTHIHLDHAGGVGGLAAELEGLRVFVHERGAKHVIDPTVLAESARRLYGDRMDALWGELLPVPAASVVALRGGEHLDVAGAQVAVAYTPGHASHHVVFLDEDSGTACVGDVGGVRVTDTLCVMPPTPPPDIDLDLWVRSLDAIRAWRPTSLFLTHFGVFGDAEAHLADLERRLPVMAGLVRQTLEEPAADDGERIRRFEALVRADLAREFGSQSDISDRLAVALPYDHDWQGLARYWRKRA
jgi:glyoxylase-like metal-dependent hydrolase (beta-lactamase superfamily II)